MESVILEIDQLWGSSLFRKCSKFNLDFKNAKKIRGIFFFLWNNCTWIGCVELSLLRREYLSSSVNVWTTNCKIFHITNRDFFFWDNSIWIGYVKLFLSRREKFSSAVNLLTTSLKILLITKRDFSKLN